MKPVLLTTRSFVCPHCNNHKFNYEHLCQQEVAGEWRWFCNNCGSEISFSLNEQLELEVTNIKVAKHPKALVLLRLEPNDGDSLKKPLYLIISTLNYRHTEDLAEYADQQAYYYNEHTCPSNFLGGNTVIYGNDDDPHGIFQFVEAIWMPEGFDSTEFHNNGSDYTTLFQSLRQLKTVE